jgi:hypothetical protein
MVGGEDADHVSHVDQTGEFGVCVFGRDPWKAAMGSVFEGVDAGRDGDGDGDSVGNVEGVLALLALASERVG